MGNTAERNSSSDKILKDSTFIKPEIIRGGSVSFDQTLNCPEYFEFFTFLATLLNTQILHLLIHIYFFNLNLFHT